LGGRFLQVILVVKVWMLRRMERVLWVWVCLCVGRVVQGWVGVIGTCAAVFSFVGAASGAVAVTPSSRRRTPPRPRLLLCVCVCMSLPVRHRRGQGCRLPLAPFSSSFSSFSSPPTIDLLRF
jgi:hypothetical protein